MGKMKMDNLLISVISVKVNFLIFIYLFMCVLILEYCENQKFICLVIISSEMKFKL